MEFTRKIEWTPAFNRVSEGYGRGSMDVRFVLIGEKAAIQFLLMTGWGHSSDRTPDGMIDCPDGQRRPAHTKPLPADIGYHAREPQYGAQDVAREHCEYLGAPCYYDGSGLRAAHFFDVLTDSGEEALWKALEEEYEARFIVGVPATIDNVNMGELLSTVFGPDTD